MHPYRFQQPAYRPTPSPERGTTPTTASTPPSAASPLPAPSVPVVPLNSTPELLAPGTTLARRVLTVDEVAASIARRPDASGVAGIMAIPQPDSPRAAKRFAQTSEAVARGWSHLSRAAVAQANARNTAALSIQRAVQIGAEAQKICDDATLHRAKTLDEIAEIADRAEIRDATRAERIQTALLQARLDRQRARHELDASMAKATTECAERRHSAAAMDLEAARLRIAREREERIAAEQARLEALGADMRARTFLAQAALEHDRVAHERVELREQAERARYDAAFARQPATPAGTPPTPDDLDVLLASLGTTPAREELRTFLAPALHGVLECHPLAALVRSVYRSASVLDARPKSEALREAARAALAFLERPREQWPSDLTSTTRHALADVEARIAAKQRADLRATIDEEDAVYFGTDPLRPR